MLPIAATEGPDGGVPSWSDVRAMAEAAESAGLDSVWFADHFFYRAPDGEVTGMHEAWTLVAAVAAVTRRVRVGTMVLCSSFREPGLVAKMAAAADVVAPGRIVLGLGAGWHDPEYEAFGYPIDHRVGRFAEALEIVARLLRGERVTFEGEYHRVADATLEPPAERRIPILVASFGPRILDLTARWADEWNTAWYGPPGEKLQRRLEVFEAAMAAAGRDPATLWRTVGLTVRDPDQPPIAEPEADALAGSVDDLARGLEAYAALGFDEAVVGLEPMTKRSVERLGTAVRRMAPAAAPA
jgi:FMNH2-dependent dimethyl sulfone monooxygenase